VLNLETRYMTLFEQLLDLVFKCSCSGNGNNQIIQFSVENYSPLQTQQQRRNHRSCTTNGYGFLKTPESTKSLMWTLMMRWNVKKREEKDKS
jgi:hypothetical protein